MTSDILFLRQVARTIALVSTIIYLSLLGVIIFELMISVTSGRPSQNLGFEVFIFTIFLITSCASAFFVAVLSRFRPSLHHARKHLGEHVRRLGNNELDEHLAHRH